MALVVVLAGVWAGQGQAAEWKVDPRFDLSASYDDNLSLASQAAAKQSATNGTIDASVDLTGRWPTASLVIQPRILSYGYSGNVDQNSTDAFVTARLTQTGQKSRTGLMARYTYQSLFRQYLSGSDIRFDLGGISNSADLRAINGRNRQKLLEASPTLTYLPTQRVNLNLVAYFTNSDYGRRTADYISYRSAYGLASAGYAVTPRSTASIRLIGSRFRPDAGVGSQTTGLQGEWSTSLSTVQRYYVRFGADRTTFDSVGAAAAAPGKTTPSGGIGASWVWQVNGLFADVTRNVYPSSTGRTTTNTELRFRFQHLFTQRLYANLTVHGVQYDVVGGNAPTTDGSRYLIFGASGEWRFTKTMSLRGTVSRASQRLYAQAAAGTDNSILLSFIYEPHRGTQSAAISVQ
jgi:hypothetical protein